MQPLRQIVRSVWRRPQAALLVALGVAIGTTCFSVADAALFRPLPFRDAASLAVLEAPLAVTRRLTSAMLERERLRVDVSRSVLAGIYVKSGDLTAVDSIQRPNEAPIHYVVSANFFDALGLKTIYGRPLSDRDLDVTPRRAVIGFELWRRKFDRDPGVIGSKRTISGEEVEIIGVADAGVAFPVGANLWTAFRPPATIPPSFVRMTPGTTLDQLSAEFPRLEVYSVERLVRPQNHLEALIFWSAGLLTVAIAVIQLLSLQFSQAISRAQEMWTRHALGASSRRVASLFVVEGYVQGLAGVAGAWILIPPLTGLAASVLPFEVTRGQPIHSDGRALAFSLVVALVMSGVSLVVASRCVWKLQLGSMRSSTSTSARAPLWNRCLLASQVFSTALLLYVSGLAAHSFSLLSKADLGFDPSHLVVGWSQAPSGPRAAPVLEDLDATEKEIRQLAGVSGVARVLRFPLAPGQFRGTLRHLDDATFPPTTIRVNYVGPEFFSVVGSTLVAGAGLSTATPDGAVANEKLAVLLGGRASAVGQHVEVTAFRGRIAGVVKNIANSDAGQPADPEIFMLGPPSLCKTLLVRVSDDTGRILEQVRAVFEANQTTGAVTTVRPMATYQRAAMAAYRGRSTLLAILSVGGLVLAATGISGALVLYVRQRRRELGIRRALGATNANMWTLLVRQILGSIAIGGACGVAAGVVAGMWLETLFLSVTPLDLGVVLASSAVLIGATAVAMLVPTAMALKVQPAIALRD
jgi:putative ABC transport system permease protein